MFASVVAKQQPVEGAPHPTRVENTLEKNEIVIWPQYFPENLWASTISDGSNVVHGLRRCENMASGFHIIMYSIPVDARRYLLFPYGFHLVELDL